MKKKNLLILVSGSVGATNLDAYLYYLKEFFNIKVLLTDSAKYFINKELITYFCDEVYDQLFMENVVPHVALPYEADIVLVLPATANIIGKIANGIADDLVTSSALNVSGKMIFCPNMNARMWENQIVQRNVLRLKELGHVFLVDTKRTYEVGLKKAIDSMCVLPVPQDLVKKLIKLT